MINQFSILLCFTSAIFLGGCDNGMEDEHHTVDYFTYHNKLDIPISMDYYSNIEGDLITKNVEIGVGKFLFESYNMEVSEPLDVLTECDSVRIVFNNEKELWYFQIKERDKTGSVFNFDNYRLTEDTKYQRSYEYDFTTEILELATDIK